MTWLMWRQHRGEVAIIVGVFALLAVVLIATGHAMDVTFQQLGIGACIAHPDQNPNCQSFVESFREQYANWEYAVPWLNVVPPLLAILVGAPLVAREVENRTHHMVWTQSITRYRWLVVKLLGILAGGILVGFALIALVSWWRTPFDQLDGRFTPAGYDLEGVVQAAFVLYALALAIAAGALLRKTIPAMAATLAGFLALRLPIEFWLRSRFQPAITATWDPLTQSGPQPGRGAWQVDSGFVDSAGHTLGFNQVFNTCAPNSVQISTKGNNPFTQCLHAHGWQFFTAYQPADRFWTFQGIETGIYVVVAIALVALTIWWVRRRIA